jgi:hypothetical protein
MGVKFLLSPPAWLYSREFLFWLDEAFSVTLNSLLNVANRFLRRRSHIALMQAQSWVMSGHVANNTMFFLCKVASQV